MCSTRRRKRFAAYSWRSGVAAAAAAEAAPRPDVAEEDVLR
jgi:hypothetical protein